MTFRDCEECGGKCCKFFGVPAKWAPDLNGAGVPLEEYKSDLEPNPRRYFELHERVRVGGDRFVVNPGVPTTEFPSRRLGPYIIVRTKCKNLTADGRCADYENRPDMCRNFVASTASRYLVPRGCIFDAGNYGEDFNV